MCVVAAGDAADRVAENLNRRLRQMRVVVSGTRLPQILEQPRPCRTRLDILLGFDPS